MTNADDDHAVAIHIAGADAYPPRWAQDAAAFRAGLGARATLDVSYGPSPRMIYDLFWPEDTPKGLLIFVHGGYWLRFDGKSWSHYASGALARGWAVAVPTYDLCPTVSIPLITQQVAQLVRHLAAKVAGPIALTGHSAGGHLVARMAAPGMLKAAIVDRISHIAPISPVAHLEPLMDTTMNDAFGLDAGTARTESPIYQPPPSIPVSVWVGGDERPVFQDHAQRLSTAWEVPCHAPQGRHHFDVIDALIDPDSDLLKTLLAAGLCMRAGTQPG